MSLITVSSFTIPADNVADGALTLRLWYNYGFLDSSGQFVASGTANSGTYFTFSATALNGTITVSALSIYSTLDAQVPYPQSIQIYSQIYRGNTALPIFPFNQIGTPPSWIVPDDLGASISFETWTIANQRIVLTNPPQTFYTAAETDALFGSIAYAPASTSQLGIVRVSNTPTDPLIPIAVETTDRRVGDFYNIKTYGAATTNTATQNATAIAAAVTAANSAGGGIYIPVGTFSTNSVTISVPVEFAPSGSILAPATGQTVTITKAIIADTSQHFSNALAGQGTISFSGNRSIPTYYPQWWGVKGDTRSTGAVTMSSGSPDISASAGTFTSADVGRGLAVANISGGNYTSTGVSATILAVNGSGSTATLSANAPGNISASYAIVGSLDSAPLQAMLDAQPDQTTAVFTPNLIMFLTATIQFNQRRGVSWVGASYEGFGALGSSTDPTFNWFGADGGTIFALDGVNSGLFSNFKMVPKESHITAGVAIDMDQTAGTMSDFTVDNLWIGNSGGGSSSFVGIRLAHTSASNVEQIRILHTTIRIAGGSGVRAGKGITIGDTGTAGGNAFNITLEDVALLNGDVGLHSYNGQFIFNRGLFTNNDIDFKVDNGTYANTISNVHSEGPKQFYVGGDSVAAPIIITNCRVQAIRADLAEAVFSTAGPTNSGGGTLVISNTRTSPIDNQLIFDGGPRAALISQNNEFSSTTDASLNFGSFIRGYSSCFDYRHQSATTGPLLLPSTTSKETTFAWILRAEAVFTLGTPATFPNQQTNPTVIASSYFITANTGATAYAEFREGVEGQILTILVTDALSTIKNNSVIKPRSGGDITCGINTTYSFILHSGIWYQVN